MLFPDLRTAIGISENVRRHFFDLSMTYLSLRKQKELVFEHCESLRAGST